VDFDKIERMTKLDNREQDQFLIYPESSKKAGWDLFMTFVLLVTCFKSPYDIAFSNENSPLVDNIIDWTIDCLFLLDILIIFNTAFYDDDIQLIDDRKEIAFTYLRSWFFIDFLACIPFDDII